MILGKTVGARLPAIAVSQPTLMQQADR
ncbi:hypothetical protein SAMN05216197_14624, partial [Pseudomonas graminis]